MKASTMHANLRAQARLVTWSAPKLMNSGAALAAVLHQKMTMQQQMAAVATIQMGGSR